MEVGGTFNAEALYFRVNIPRADLDLSGAEPQIVVGPVSGSVIMSTEPLWLNYNVRVLRFSQRYRGSDKSLARPTSRCILFDAENISFDASLVIYINSTNIPPIMIINRIYEHQNLLSL